MLTFSAAGLTRGTYTTTLQASGNAPSVQAPVTLTVLAPELTVNPSALGVALSSGGTATRTLTLSNTGEADLNWSLAENPERGWLSESTTGGTIAPLGGRPVTVTFNTAGLSSGAYTTTLQITGNVPTANIPVMLIVDPKQVYLPLILK
jgi:hypothetical protein